jgi:hypothetical protein
MSCGGLIIFDGRRWYSQLPPPAALVGGPGLYAWMHLGVDGRTSFTGPRGTVSFDPDTGQSPDCSHG